MISISHLGRDCFLECMNMMVHEFAYKSPECPLPSGMWAGHQTIHINSMQWDFSGRREFSSPLVPTGGGDPKTYPLI